MPKEGSEMEFGVAIPTHARSFEWMVSAAQEAERLGYSSLWVGDHFYAERSTYLTLGGDPDKPDKLDPWITLAALASRTGRIRLGVRVSPLPYYQPSRLAKMVATLDIISNGRVLFGVGAGWVKDEFIRYGLGWDNFETRILKMREALEVIIRLWTQDRASYNGRYYSLREAPLFPKPVQKPYPPIWFGGAARAILEDTARLGAGWTINAYGKWSKIPLEDLLKKCIGQIRMLAESFGRNSRSIAYAPLIRIDLSKQRAAEDCVCELKRLCDVGANYFIVYVSSATQALDELRVFKECIQSVNDA
jgi:probable F420-dependent oxidoreductase